MMSLKGNSNPDPSKDKGKGKDSTSKHSEDKNPSDSMNMESLQRIIKKLSNDLIDLKKGGGEGSSIQKKFFRFPPKMKVRNNKNNLQSLKNLKNNN
jgi:hypothetical protein